MPKGPKAVLRERLLAALAEEEAEDDDDEEEEEGVAVSGQTNVDAEAPGEDTDDGVSDSANYERNATTNGADSSDDMGKFRGSKFEEKKELTAGWGFLAY